MSRAYPARYHFVRELGVGTLGRVDLVRDVKENATVVVRTLDERLLSISDWPSRFRSTCHAIIAMSSPYLVPVVDFEVDGSKAFQVMAQAPGEPLAEVLKSSKMSLHAASAVLSQIIDALDDLHSMSRHGGLSPRKVMLTREGRGFSVALRDAGCGVEERDRLSLGLGGMTTLRYLAPEQVLLEDVDHRADLFAVGAIGYELLSGCPLGPDKPFELFHARLNEAAPALTLADGSADPELDTFLAVALQRAPRDRYESAAQMKQALTDIAERRGWRLPERRISAAEVSTAGRPLRKALAAAGTVVLACGAAIYIAASEAPSPKTVNPPVSAADPVDAGVKQPPPDAEAKEPAPAPPKPHLDTRGPKRARPPKPEPKPKPKPEPEPEIVPDLPSNSMPVDF